MDKLKVFSAYLPYKLKGQLISDKTDDFAEQEWVNNVSIFKKGAIWDLCGYADEKGELMIPLGEGYFEGWLWRNKTTYVNFHSGIKPILFSLEDLTKPITIGGETFVPLHRILEEYCFNLERMEDDEILSYKESLLEIDISYKVHSLLLEWKFNVFNLPEDEYVKVTDEFNPYK